MRPFIISAILLFPLAARAEDKAVRITKAENVVEFRVGEELVARYQHSGTVPKEKGEGTKPLAKPFFWPVSAPGGATVTAYAPSDHIHHKSVWFCHGDVIPEGLELKTKSSDKRVRGVDFWSENPGHGRIVCVEVGEPKQVSANHAVIPTRNEWVAPDGTKVLDETRTIHLTTLPSGRFITLDIDLHASVCPITFGDTKEGSLGVRVHQSIREAAKQGGVLSNSAGKSGEKEVWGQPFDWTDYSGAVDGQPVGIALFDHPSNTPRAASHGRGYGLMAGNPFGRDKSFPSQKGNTDLVRLAKGDHLKLRYGVYAHTGDAAAGKVAEAYQTFAGGK